MLLSPICLVFLCFGLYWKKWIIPLIIQIIVCLLYFTHFMSIIWRYDEPRLNLVITKVRMSLPTTTFLYFVVIPKVLQSFLSYVDPPLMKSFNLKLHPFQLEYISGLYFLSTKVGEKSSRGWLEIKLVFQLFLNVCSKHVKGNIWRHYCDPPSTSNLVNYIIICSS